MTRPLYKTTIVIWSDLDPSAMEISRLAREAETGDAYCSSSLIRRVQTPELDEDWDETDFFDTLEDGFAGEDDE
jgi:hypothetical protein